MQRRQTENLPKTQSRHHSSHRSAWLTLEPRSSPHRHRRRGRPFGRPRYEHHGEHRRHRYGRLRRYRPRWRARGARIPRGRTCALLTVHKRREHGHHHAHEHEEHDHEHHHGHEHEEHEHGHHHGHGEHDHHHHDHDADEVVTSWGIETPKKFSEDAVKEILKKLADKDSTEYGIILRAKGIVQDEEGKWLHFDLVPGEEEVRYGAADYTGRICVIGSDLKEDKLAELFGL